MGTRPRRALTLRLAVNFPPGRKGKGLPPTPMMHGTVFDVDSLREEIHSYLDGDISWFSRVFWEKRRMTDELFFELLSAALGKGDVERVRFLTTTLDYTTFLEEGRVCFLEAAGLPTLKGSPLVLLQEKWEDYSHIIYHIVSRSPPESIIPCLKILGLHGINGSTLLDSLSDPVRYPPGSEGKGHAWGLPLPKEDGEEKRAIILIKEGYFHGDVCMMDRKTPSIECVLKYNESDLFRWRYTGEGLSLFLAPAEKGARYDIKFHNEVLDLCIRKNPSFLRFILPGAAKNIKKRLESCRTPHRDVILTMLEECGIDSTTVGYPFHPEGECPDSCRKKTYTTWKENVEAGGFECSIVSAVDAKDERLLREILAHPVSRAGYCGTYGQKAVVPLLSSFRDSEPLANALLFFETSSPPTEAKTKRKKRRKTGRKGRLSEVVKNIICDAVHPRMSLEVLDWLKKKYPGSQDLDSAMRKLCYRPDLYDRRDQACSGRHFFDALGSRRQLSCSSH